MLASPVGGCGGADPGPLGTASVEVDGGAANDAGATDIEADGGAVAEGAAPDADPDGGDPADVADAGTTTGTAGPDAAPACVPHCPAGVGCGVASDVCGTGPMQCGTCSGRETCGGGGKPGVCGCTPAACVAGQSCGSVPDNCGGTEDCGACPTSGVCSAGSCLSFVALGCQVGCTGSYDAPNVCVELLENGGPVANYLCNSSAGLPTDRCSQAYSAPPGSTPIPNLWQCCARPDCT